MGLFSILKTLTGCDSFSFHYGYNVSKGHVYYKRPFPDPVIDMDVADAETFKVLSREEDSMYADNTYYGVDKNHVFYKGFLLQGGDPATFELLHVNYAKDKFHVYFRGTALPDADPATFRIINDHFSADKGNIFKREMVIDHDTSLFETFNEGNFVHTKNAVCIYDQFVPAPAGSIFKFLGHNYFAFDNQVYFWDKPMPDADVESFIAFDDFNSKTKDHAYYRDSIIVGANAASYKILNPPYASDGQHIFFFERIIEGADPKTFEIINVKFQCARDKNAAYYEDKRITNVTKSDLVNKNECTNCDEARVYFADTARKDN